jgi:D-alanyl-D-alanine endopeptidase (penicillin-binding protein 7)
LNWFVLGWLLVVILLALKLIIGLFWLHQYRNASYSNANRVWQQRLDALASKFSPGMQVLLRVVDDIQSPLTIGCIKPVVLVPASLLTGMAPAHLEALLAHELAHIRRYDFLINLLQNLIEMFLFFHPAVWWISKNIRIERENIADDLAAQVLGEPRRLALALQELEQIQFVQSQLALAAHGGNLMLRIKRLVRPEAQSINWKTAVTAVGIATACIGFAANAAMPKYATKNSQHGTASIATSADSQIISPEEMVQPLTPSFDAEKADVDTAKSTKPAKRDVIIPARVNFSKAGCKPEYPRAALRNESQGVSRLLVHVSATGAIDEVEIVKSSGHTLLDDAVKNQLLSGSCTNKPGSINGKAQATKTRVDYVWKLD